MANSIFSTTWPSKVQDSNSLNSLLSLRLIKPVNPFSYYRGLNNQNRVLGYTILYL